MQLTDLLLHFMRIRSITRSFDGMLIDLLLGSMLALLLFARCVIHHLHTRFRDFRTWLRIDSKLLIIIGTFLAYWPIESHGPKFFNKCSSTTFGQYTSGTAARVIRSYHLIGYTHNSPGKPHGRKFINEKANISHTFP